ncbi:hypothetical protein NQ317_019916 [Molorchus minor]|uniref:Secreted protein n=1 Tax=Molorchus minor TaxID=1323400 RepID=A0ABQ9K4L4_9CUCU|nr:hypothetical protein NQ317_019916 [Molorchus minor]
MFVQPLLMAPAVIVAFLVQPHSGGIEKLCGAKNHQSVVPYTTFLKKKVDLSRRRLDYCILQMLHKFLQGGLQLKRLHANPVKSILIKYLDQKHFSLLHHRKAPSYRDQTLHTDLPGAVSP